jgi:hypothetical protein
MRTDELFSSVLGEGLDEELEDVDYCMFQKDRTDATASDGVMGGDGLYDSREDSEDDFGEQISMSSLVFLLLTL